MAAIEKAVYGICTPFDAPETHRPTLEAVSPRPLMQFLTEVEELLVANELI
jgi:hypothetical protein